MKNKFKRALNCELQSVHVSSDLKRRILQEAERTRFQAERRRSFAPFLSAAAAIVVILGLSLGVVSLRASAPQQHQATLAQGDGDYVWIQSEDTIYHQDVHCGGMSGAIRVKIENAKASGRTPCAVCVSGTSVSPETTSGVTPTSVQWAESTPEPTVAPTVENVSLYTPTPEPFREAEVSSAQVQWATSTPEPTVAPTMVISHSYTPVPETFETVVLLSKGEVDSKKIRVEFSLEDMDMSEFQDGATYTQIKDYVLEHSGLKVSNLYISQIKRKCGIEVGKNYNLPKSEDSRQPQCPPEKEKAIREALKYFGMI